MPINQEGKDVLSFYHKKLNCVDEENLLLYGDYGSYKASLFNVQFVKCHD